MNKGTVGIIYTTGANLAFPDLLSRNVPIADVENIKLNIKRFQKK